MSSPVTGPEPLWQGLGKALQDFATARAEEEGEPAPIVMQAVVVWEETSLQGDEMGTRIRYCVPTDNFSISGAIGLLAAGDTYLRRDTLQDDE